MRFVHQRNVLLESYGSDDVFDVRSRPIRAAGECDVVRRVSERDQERSERYRLRFVRRGDVLVESYGSDDLLVVLSRHLRQRVRRHRLPHVRFRSLRLERSIVDLRGVLAGDVHVVRGVEYVHVVRSRKVRTERRGKYLRRMSERYKKQRRRLCVSTVRRGDVLVESHGSDDVFDVRSRPLRVAVKFDIVRHVSERDQERSER